MNTAPNEKPPNDGRLATAEEACETMIATSEDRMVRTAKYVRQNPTPFVLGAIACGVAIGYLVVVMRREPPTFRERYVDEPLHKAREAVYATLADVAHRVQEEYDSARDGAGKAMVQLQRSQPARTLASWSDQIRRAGSNLKFW